MTASDDRTRELHAWMVAHEREAIDLLGRIVNMDSSTLHRDGVEALARLTVEQLHLWPHRPPMPWTPATDRLAALVSEAAAAMGTRIETISTMGGSDANFVAALGVPALCGLGPGGGAVMTREEYIELRTLAERAALVAALAHKLGRGDAP
ncbi:MAG: M20/M25/M40 family metallo-hydrolase [Candidatus Rokubacteria bacterium]|nr:M20/M25/M40 family metallo-hydrolase [Candidatus Rokubacteria bacterium]